jgi:hypothetical protein
MPSCFFRKVDNSGITSSTIVDCNDFTTAAAFATFVAPAAGTGLGLAEAASGVGLVVAVVATVFATFFPAAAGVSAVLDWGAGAASDPSALVAVCFPAASVLDGSSVKQKYYIKSPKNQPL